jgi:plastocyanin
MAGPLISHLRPILCVVGFGTAAVGCGGDGDGGTPPPTVTIAKASSNNGDAQTGTVGQALAAPLGVVVTEAGAPSAGATVTWSTTSPGASLAASSVTDPSGIATNAWTLGTVSGPQTAQASLTGASGSPVSFSATATPDAAALLSKLSGDAQNAEINNPLPAPVQAKVADQFGNGVPGVDVAWAATGATVSAPNVPSDASGTSAVNVTLGGTEGPITITATATALTGSPVTFTATALAAGPSTAAVSVVNNSFTPSSLPITAGTTVVWTWAANAQQHNVVSVGALFPGSGSPVDGPHTYQFGFDVPGTYNYYCQIHGTPTTGMRGTIIVQ